MAFELPQLPYANDALEPHIDAKPWRYTTVNTTMVTQQNSTVHLRDREWNPASRVF